MTETRGFACETCFDTGTVDSGGREVYCPDCKVTVKLTGLGWGLGMTGERYNTVSEFTETTMKFEGTRFAILCDVTAVSRKYIRFATDAGRKGRNSISSGALAIERRVREALA